jgi:hypothetical protein
LPNAIYPFDCWISHFSWAKWAESQFAGGYSGGTLKTNGSKNLHSLEAIIDGWNSCTIFVLILKVHPQPTKGSKGSIPPMERT